MCYHLISKTILIDGWYGHYFKVKGTFRVAKKLSQVIYMCGSRVHIYTCQAPNYSKYYFSLIQS